MYYDAAEALPEKPLPKEEVQPIGSRYDGSIMVFGKAMQVRSTVARVPSCSRVGLFTQVTPNFDCLEFKVPALAHSNLCSPSIAEPFRSEVCDTRERSLGDLFLFSRDS